MVRARAKTGTGTKESDNNPIAVRVDPATRAALEVEADRAGMKLGPYCRGLLERHVSGQSLEILGNEIAELVREQERQNERLDQLGVGHFEALRTLLLNLTDIKEEELRELRQRVLGR